MRLGVSSDGFICDSRIGSFTIFSFQIVIFSSTSFICLMNCIKGSVPVAHALPQNLVKPSSKACKPQITNYITIFDYDDTFLPSSWLTHLIQLKVPFTEEIKKQLELVDESASSLLQEAMCHSTVIIVTNAEQGWVEESSRIFMPKFHSLLNRITVISARSQYETSYPSSSSLWKELTFRDEISKLSSFSDFPSILSIGDSLHEREAVFSYGRNNSRCLVKSIKLIELPTPVNLASQQKIILNSLSSMIYSSERLDLKLSIQNA